MSERVGPLLRIINSGAQDRQNNEGERYRVRRLGRDVIGGNAGLDHHQRKIRDRARLIAGQAGAQTLLHQVKRRKRRRRRG